MVDLISQRHVELAPAKINLFLRILGRRPDGFHELQSLVCFAQDICDRLTFTLRPVQSRVMPTDIRVVTRGRFASDIIGANLAMTALSDVAIFARVSEFSLLELEKNLPVASGIGGGSADAAAVLRAARTCFGSPQDIDWTVLAAKLGADVPVCVGSRASWMTGLGETVTRLMSFPPLAAILVNPITDVPADKTAQVFKTLHATALEADALTPPVPDVALDFSTPETLIAGLATLGNDLQEAALKVLPDAEPVIAALDQVPGCKLAQLSGAGPTGFGLFVDFETAEAAASELKKRQPAWWIAATRLS